MSDIKVLVAVNGSTKAILGSRGGLFYITEPPNSHKNPTNERIEKLKSIGWTIQPMTLTKGHKE